MIKGVIFDLDNTLCNYNESAINGRIAVFNYLKGKYNFITDEMLQEAFHKSSVDALREYLNGKINERMRQILRFSLFLKYLGLSEKENADFLRNLYYKEGIKNLSLYDGVLATLRTLRGRFKLAIITNGLTDLQNKKLDKIGIRRYFDCIVISEAVGIDKPDSKIFEVALNCLRLDKNEVIYVGDDPIFDIVGAKKAGLIVVWFNSQNKELPPTYPKPDFEIYKMKDLLKIVLESAQQK